MTVQELSDRLLVLSHEEGLGQAEVLHVTGFEIKEIGKVMVVDDKVLLGSRED
jgi:hypothetical protein